jgi:hypothetical protein
MSIMRTVAVFIGGAILSFVVSAVLVTVLLPNSGELIVAMFKTPRNSPNWNDLWTQWQHMARITVFVIGPLIGIAVGVFVGLLHRRNAMLLAVCALVPDFLVGVLGDRARYWSGSFSGVALYVVHHSFPFIAAALSAYMVQRLSKSDMPLQT